jgi:UDP-N-acetylmuramoyl-tripeptide--D-alanyl-D-alanine ligase
MGTRAAIALEKGSLAEALPAHGCLILDTENEFAEQIARRTAAKVIRAGVNRGEVCGSDVQLEAAGSRFKIHALGETVAAFLPVPGLHMVRNALLAVAAGLEHGLTLEECAAGLARVQLTKGRVEQKLIHGIQVIDDSYNANPDSMIAALQTIAQLPSTGRRFAVLGRMGELGPEAESGHRAVGTAAAHEQIGCVISVGREADWISEAARAGGVEQVFNTPDPESAVKLLRSLARPGDVILVKGSRSARMERVVEGLAL